MVGGSSDKQSTACLPQGTQDYLYGALLEKSVDDQKIQEILQKRLLETRISGSARSLESLTTKITAKV